jgi:hypothetical protein
MVSSVRWTVSLATSCARSYCWLAASPRVLVKSSTFFFEFLKIGSRLGLLFLAGGSVFLRLPATYVCHIIFSLCLRRAAGADCFLKIKPLGGRRVPRLNTIS